MYIQNAILEISQVNVLEKYKTITGRKIISFFSQDFEGFDINYPFDIELLKLKLKKKLRFN